MDRTEERRPRGPGVRRDVSGLRSISQWSPDDPRIVDLADRLSAHALRLIEENGPDATDTHAGDFEDQFVELLDAVALERAPALPRLAELLAERGWTGWHRTERGNPAPDSPE